MKLLVCSDLHLEFSDIAIENSGADVLVLSGDITIASSLREYPRDSDPSCIDSHHVLAKRTRSFLEQCSAKFQHVVMVSGNHELYHGDFHRDIDTLQEECSWYDNVHFLENDSRLIDGVLFVGAALWTDCNKGDPQTMNLLPHYMNDYRVIRHNDKAITTIDTVDRHKGTMKYFEETITDPDQPVIVVGHHAPTTMSIHERYKDGFVMNGGFASDLSEFIVSRPQIRLWTCGHTHHAHWYYTGDTLVVCNPRGYQRHDYSERSNWDPFKVFDLDNLPSRDKVAATTWW